MKKWICPQCSAEALYKGLCRDCTEYSDDGKVVNPVARVREGVHVHDENCGEGCGHTHRLQAPTLAQFRAARRPKMTKKQMKAYYDILEEANFTEGTVEDAREILVNAITEEE